MHDPTLLDRRMLLVGTKLDALPDHTRVDELAALADHLRVPWAAISAVSGEGLQGMLEQVFALAG